MKKASKYRLSADERKLVFIKWSQMTMNVLHLLKQISDGGNEEGFSGTNITGIVLLHQMTDQMINETLARNLGVTLGILNNMQSDQTIYGPPDKTRAAATIMMQTLSSRSQKICNYLQLIGSEPLPSSTMDRLNSFLDLRDFIYHADVVGFYEDEVPGVASDFFKSFGIKLRYNDNWFDMIKSNATRDLIQGFLLNQVFPKCEYPNGEGKCAFTSLPALLLNGNGFVNSVMWSGSLMENDFHWLKPTAVARFQELLQTYLEKTRQQLRKKPVRQGAKKP